LATKPEVQDKLRAEIVALLEKSPSPSYAEIEHMSYMNKFVKELLRLYSPGEYLPTHLSPSRPCIDPPNIN
jgi:cytochrome P450